MKSRKAQKGNQEKKEKEVTKSLAHDADKKKHDFEGHHDIKRNHPLKDWAVKLTIVFASVLLIKNSTNVRVDAKKVDGVSFASQYISGDLHQVNDITQILVAAFASLFFDFFVIFYHLTYPAHPKFVMVLPRKISIYVHLISGITEITSGVAAFFVASQGLQQFFATIVSLASISHSITAYYQSSIVFGAKGVMTPAYLYCITLHLACAFNLLTNPTSLVNLVSTFLMLHIYVWCRFFVYFFRKFKAFSGYHYTVAITLSGALLLPYVSGPIANFTLLFIVALYCILEAIVSGKTGSDLSRKLFSEHERYALVRSDSVNAWKEHLSDTGATNDEKLAREVFDRYDSNHSGILSVNELHELLSSLDNGLSTEKVLAMADVNGDGQISFGEFYRFIWNYGSMKDRIVKIPKTQAGAKKKMSEKELAKLVFNMLDTDGSGYIDLAELEMLLTQWGMPENEADTYLAKYASGKDRNISFDVFYTQMKPIWAFGASEVFEA